MTYTNRITERIIKFTTITFVALVLLIFNARLAQAQGNTQHDNHVKNVGIDIRVASEVSEITSAIPMESINSPFAELKPVFVPGGNRLYFSRSFHPGNTGGRNDQEDIWYTEYIKTTGKWAEPARMPGYLNNEGANFIESVSVTGDTIVLGNQYLKRGKMRNGVSYSVNVNGTWSRPIPIYVEDDYNMSNHENHYVDLQSGIILSAIERDGTTGKRDLYVSFWNGESATAPVNLGNTINTEYEESSPYLAHDNKTLYFASKGHNGFGGHDIYVTTRLDESWTNWTTPQNLGAAVNGPLDEEFFTITHCGKFAIFAKQVSIHNTDLYRIATTVLSKQPIEAVASID